MSVVKFNAVRQGELFISINNHFYVYLVDEMGMGIQMKLHHTFNNSVISVAQDADTLLICCDNDTLLVYDWTIRKMVDEIVDFASAASCVAVCQHANNRSFLAGTKNGEVFVFKPKSWLVLEGFSILNVLCICMYVYDICMNGDEVYQKNIK